VLRKPGRCYLESWDGWVVALVGVGGAGQGVFLLGDWVLQDDYASVPFVCESTIPADFVGNRQV